MTAGDSVLREMVLACEQICESHAAALRQIGQLKEAQLPATMLERFRLMLADLKSRITVHGGSGTQ